jgi:hypothetical protein
LQELRQPQARRCGGQFIVYDFDALAVLAEFDDGY